jgi:tetratricopeptide (TPR) repeat protein
VVALPARPHLLLLEEPMKGATLFLFSSLLLGTWSMTQELPAPALSPAQISIQRAETQIARTPENARVYSELAIALARRARETSDTTFYMKADEAVEKSLTLKPGNYAALKARTWILLGRHEFFKALQLAEQLQKQNPDDVVIYGYLTDASAELGNYSQAEKSAQWMLDLRPGNVPGLTRAAYLRELFGDLDGALELMRMAYDSTSPAEREDQAWLLTQMAHLQLLSGHVQDAEDLANQALQRFPGYHYALANLAKVRISQHRYSDAVELLRQRFKAAPHAENLFDLAEALEMARSRKEAQVAFKRFEAMSLAESARADNSNRELILYYIDRAKRPLDALRIAEKEFQVRKDVFTLDSYAWALYANGKIAEARRQIDAAKQVGVRDPKILEHYRFIVFGKGKPAKRSG